MEAVNFISHATQSRLRTVLEKVSSIAQHRMDGGKVSSRARDRHTYQEVGAFYTFHRNLFFKSLKNN